MDRLYKKLEAYGKSDFYPFHMPGHKRNPLSVAGDFSVQQDITEINGFDNLHHPETILKEAQENAARLYQVQESFFCINGSTGAILAAVSAAVKKGGHILIARNCHKAVYHAAYLRDLKVSYIYPHEDAELGINGGISPQRVERCLDENPDIEAVLLTSPTYDGIVSDIKTIAEITHSHNIPLIVDEAHGAHFCFSDYFPVSAAELGADIVIHSLHKTLPSMTQTALLHRCSERVDRNLLVRFLGIYQTSSPSYVLMASMDACMYKIEQDGQRMFAEYTENLERARKRLRKGSCIRLVEPGDPAMNVFDADRSKIILSTVHGTMNGRQLAEVLRQDFHLEIEMEAENYVIALTSVGDTEEGFDRLCRAVEEIDSRDSLKYSEEAVKKERCRCAELNSFMRISCAMDALSERCTLEESIGRISVEFAYLYPPGIPLVVPGEQITGLLIKNMKRYLEQGLELQGLSDMSDSTILVLARDTREIVPKKSEGKVKIQE